MSRLFFPLQYFLIQNRTKFWIDLLPALVIASAAWGLCYFFRPVNFFGQGGVLANLMTLTAALTGFYVAALTAAATFSNPDLDHEITYGPLKLDGVPLSRRQWICHIFGYLAFAAMAFTLTVALAIPIASAARHSPGSTWLVQHSWIAPFAEFVTLWWVSHMFVVTVLGLHYLVNRMGDRTPSVVTTKETD